MRIWESPWKCHKRASQILLGSWGKTTPNRGRPVHVADDGREIDEPLMLKVVHRSELIHQEHTEPRRLCPAEAWNPQYIHRPSAHTDRKARRDLVSYPCLDVPIRGAQFAADRTAPIRSDLKSHDSNRNPHSSRFAVMSLLFFHMFQEPLNAPFLNGLFSRAFSRAKTAH